MKLSLQALVAGVVVTFGANAAVPAAEAVDPIIGTWVLDVSKSKFEPGPAPKSQTRIYTPTPDGISLVLTGVDADGAPMSQKSVFQYDGKPHPWTGSSAFDSISLKLIDAHTVRSIQMRSGKAVGTSIRTISMDGKVMTLKSKVKNEKGVKSDDTAVFDRRQDAGASG